MKPDPQTARAACDLERLLQMEQLSLEFPCPPASVNSAAATSSARARARRPSAVPQCKTKPESTAARTEQTMIKPAPPVRSESASIPAAIPPDGTFSPEPARVAALRQDRLWCEHGWTARVIKNQEDAGWAVAMYKEGHTEPTLVGPWTMGRDKKKPKPLDAAAFGTLVKTASEVLQRHQQQLHARLHKRLTVFAQDCQWEVRLEIVPDEYEPHAWLSAHDEEGNFVERIRVAADFGLTTAIAARWIENAFRLSGAGSTPDD